MTRTQKDQNCLQRTMDCMVFHCQGIFRLLGSANSGDCKDKHCKRTAHKSTCVELLKTWHRIYDLKNLWIAKNVLTYKWRTGRFSNEHAKTDKLVNDALDSMKKTERVEA